jgi:epoxyqueuosine reductase QueG
MDLRDSLKKCATDLGFDLVGIAPATPGRDLEFSREWLDRGYAGDMAYLSSPKRLNPKLLLPSLRSVICVGLIYDTPFPYSTEVGRRQEAGGREQESGDGIEAFKHSGFNSASSEPQSGEIQPSPTGRGWSAEGGAGEGEEHGPRFSSFDFRDSNLVSPAAPPRAWISRYAWGRDYHEIMREKLERFRGAIEALAPGAETRVYVDTGPVPERAFARFSGLGWMGKNTCMINEEKGSWFFLGVILTNLALEPDLPAPDRCGSCTACLDACPTGALVEPYIMNASRCISYLTIELKGSIPQDLRAGMGAYIFGCDICQDVCPWNGKSRIQSASRRTGVRSQEDAFLPMTVSTKDLETGNWKLETGSSKIENRNSKLGSDPLSAASNQPSADGRWPSIQNPESQIQNPPDTRHPTPDTISLFAPPLEALASMTEDDFRQTFRHSPIKRAKFRGWLRNLCVAMGNSGDARLEPKLEELAAHPDPMVREHAQWALEQIPPTPK